MTAATERTGANDAESYELAECWRCGGPCWQYKGSVHGWTCTACIGRYLDESEARWHAKSQKARDRLLRNLRNTAHDHINGSNATAWSPVHAAHDRRRDGGLAAGRAVSASISDNRVAALAS